VTRHPARTFLDAGVLIAAYGTQRPYTNVALEVLRDPHRIFLSSPFVRHEVCPKALFNRRQQEYRFYLEYFQSTAMFNDVRLILERAGHEAARSGVGAMDSLHIAAAHLFVARQVSLGRFQDRDAFISALVRTEAEIFDQLDRGEPLPVDGHLARRLATLIEEGEASGDYVTAATEDFDAMEREAVDLFRSRRAP